uniref:asparagine synthase (glutamine-hydrolyzing) n=1 Tax=Rhodococcus jostii TaxID=132919 RepID=H7C8I4_RHOJO|nr:lariatin biosynthetic protein [Rhodococcus jostii]
MNGIDIAVVTDDPAILKSVHERYPDGSKHSIELEHGHNVHIFVRTATLVLSSYIRDNEAIAVLGYSNVHESSMRAILESSPGVAHMNSALGQLIGAQWVVAIRKGAVRIQGTVSGLSRVYWSKRGSRFVASNRSRELARLLGSELDPTQVAFRTIHPMQHPFTSSSCWKDLEGVLPGEYLEVTGRSSPRTERWWTPATSYRSLEDGANETAAALFSVVRNQLSDHSAASCDISGGLDSSSIAAIAANAAKSGETHTVLHGTTSVSRDEFNSDADWAIELSKSLKLDSHSFLSWNDMPKEYDDLDALASYDLDEPSIASISHSRFTHLINVARSKGSQVHLTGFGGDELFIGSPTFCVDLFKTQPLLSARLLLTYRAMYRWTFRSLVRPLTTPMSYQQWMRTKSLSTDRSTLRIPPLSWGFHGVIPPWITRDARHSMYDHVRSASSATFPLAPTPGRHFELENLYQCARLFRTMSDIVSQTSGVLLVAPMLEQAVVEAAISVRTPERLTPHKYKPVLTHATRGLLPAVVAERQTKGGEDTDAAIGFSENISAIRELWDESRLASLGIVDGDYLSNALRRPDSAEFDDCAIAKTLATELWLRSLEK